MTLVSAGIVYVISIHIYIYKHILIDTHTYRYM